MECSICYCELTLKNIVNTRCSHTFCSSCFWKWVGNNNTCPMCRSGVVTSECLNKEFSSKDVVVSKNELENILESYNYFKK